MTKKYRCVACGKTIRADQSSATAFCQHWHLTCLYTAYPALAPEEDQNLYIYAKKRNALLSR